MSFFVPLFLEEFHYPFFHLIGWRFVLSHTNLGSMSFFLEEGVLSPIISCLFFVGRKSLPLHFCFPSNISFCLFLLKNKIKIKVRFIFS